MSSNKVSMTVAQLLVMDEAFGELKTSKVELKGKVLYAFSKNAEKLRELLFNIHLQRAEIFRKHGEFNTELNQFVLKDESKEDFDKDIQSFAQEVHTVEIHQIPVWMLNDHSMNLDLYERLMYANLFLEENHEAQVPQKESSRIELLKD